MFTNRRARRDGPRPRRPPPLPARLSAGSQPWTRSARRPGPRPGFPGRPELPNSPWPHACGMHLRSASLAPISFSARGARAGDGEPPPGANSIHDSAVPTRKRTKRRHKGRHCAARCVTTFSQSHPTLPCPGRATLSQRGAAGRRRRRGNTCAQLGEGARLGGTISRKWRQTRDALRECLPRNETDTINHPVDRLLKNRAALACLGPLPPFPPPCEHRRVCGCLDDFRRLRS